MVQLEIVQRKLAELDAHVARVRTHRRASPAELASDRDALDLVAFNLMLAVQAACDLATHLIADEGWTAPPTAPTPSRGLPNIRSSRRTPPQRCGEPSGSATSSPMDAGIDVAATYAASTLGLDDLDRFAREIATWLVSRPG